METIKPVERQKFYKAILRVFENGEELTARECASRLLPTGLTIYGARQEVQPRLTEMIEKGWIEKAGTKIDFFTKKRVTIYRSVNLKNKIKY